MNRSGYLLKYRRWPLWLRRAICDAFGHRFAAYLGTDGMHEFCERCDWTDDD